MELKFKKLNSEAKCPEQAYDDAAAWDMFATSKKVVDTGDYGYIEYGTGLAMEIPTGYVGKIFPRSSLSKTGMILANHVGIIDPDYRGEITFRYKWVHGTKQYEVGDKIGQFRLEETIKIVWVESEDLSETTRGTGGYGSSDSKNT
jgi:dUTP pyrophosphatase